MVRLIFLGITEPTEVHCYDCGCHQIAIIEDNLGLRVLYCPYCEEEKITGLLGKNWRKKAK